MGQTLENGVYLPSEGERNCYAGLKTNWEILDQKVADVTALQQAVAGALHREIVESLPTTDIDPNTIYMILSGTSATENVYNEFMYVNNAWELIGTSATDLTNYYTKAEVDGKLLLKASVSDLTSHTGDTTIHVTTADKNKWNNNTYVLRYSSTTLVASSTNSNSLLDNTDNLKVGDKVIDASGVIYSVTAIDTVNSTFTIGTALIDLAQDSDVVHKSGNETIAGYKTFSNNMTLYNSSTSVNPVALFFKNKKVVMGSTTDIGSQNIAFRDSADTNLSILKTSCESVGNTSFEISVYNKDSNNQTVSGGMLVSQTLANTYITPTTDNAVLLGSTNRRWSKIYGTEYYYGSNNVEFSTKFVTTDTAQTISGNKNFNGNTNCVGELNQTAPFKMTADTSFVIGSKNTSIYDQNGFQCSNDLISYNNSKNIRRTWTVNNNGSGTTVTAGFNFILSASGTKVFYPITDNDTDNGSNKAYWKNTYTKRVNGVEPSSLSLPSGNANDVIDISSYLTYLDGTDNTYVAPSNGWITINMNNCSGIHATIAGFWGDSRVRASAGAIKFLMPVLKNQTVTLTIHGGTIDNARFIPCQGNV